MNLSSLHMLGGGWRVRMVDLWIGSAPFLAYSPLIGLSTKGDSSWFFVDIEDLAEEMESLSICWS